MNIFIGKGTHMSKLPGTPRLALAILAVSVAFPASATAYATPEGPPVYSAAPGLPDGRVYEQVSPADKNGNQAGATTTPEAVGANDDYGLSSPDGNSVLFEGTGPMGESPWGGSLLFVATKRSGQAGWQTRSLLPAALQRPWELGSVLNLQDEYIDPTPELTHVMFLPHAGTYAAPPDSVCEGEGGASGNLQLYLAGPNPYVPATWLNRPSPEVEHPVEVCPTYREAGAPVGGTPDFSTVYFTYPGTLLPQDAGRAPHAHPKETGEEGVEAWGFYEYHEGELREAGTLPNGTLDPYGAVPAASGDGKDPAGNQVSEDGTKAFFVSPDPASCTYNVGTNDCATDPPELYVRENSEKSVLVSEDTLLAPTGGLPAPAPTGVARMPRPADEQGGSYVAAFDGSYVFASPDGSQAFFQSDDRLTAEAPEGTAAKTYDFDLDTDTLTYLPSVSGEIVATDQDGSSFAFVRPEAGGAPAELDLWSAGPGGGTVTPVTPLPEVPPAKSGPPIPVPEARMSTDGSVLVFETSGRPSASFNSGGAQQIYRYDVATNMLACASCAPPGVSAGSAFMSGMQRAEEGIYQGRLASIVDDHAISANGERIFFETATPLVPQVTNTNSPPVPIDETEVEAQGINVYEWENGVVYLLNGGKSPRNTFLLDNSESGDDVFFATAESLAPGDTDGAYDVYDARVPHPGDKPPASAVPCEGSVCQGPPNVPSPLTPPASATFAGLGNPPLEAEVTTTATTTTATKTTKAKTVKCRSGFRRDEKKSKCVKSKKKAKAKKAGDDRGDGS
jgi:hypothetical protein